MNHDRSPYFFLGSLILLIGIGLVAVKACRTAPPPVSLDELLERPPGDASILSVLDGTTGGIASALPASFRTGVPDGCPGDGLALYVEAPRVGQPTAVWALWPPQDGDRYLLLSSRVEATPFHRAGCFLTGPTEWVFPLPPGTNSGFHLPAPPTEALGSDWGVQLMQVDATEDRRVRLSAGFWARVGG
jgi:hypothetical protein